MHGGIARAFEAPVRVGAGLGFGPRGRRAPRGLSPSGPGSAHGRDPPSGTRVRSSRSGPAAYAERARELREDPALAEARNNRVHTLREQERHGLKEVTLRPPMASARKNFADFAEHVIARYWRSGGSSLRDARGRRYAAPSGTAPRGRRGATASANDVFALLALAALLGCGPREPQHRRALLVGIDGADWRVIESLIERGRMPNLASLRERGARGPARTLSDKGAQRSEQESRRRSCRGGDR